MLYLQDCKNKQKMGVHGKTISKALGLMVGLLLCIPAYCQWDKDVLQFRGRLALSDGKYSQAIEQFNILVALQDNDCWTYFYRGIAKYNLGDVRGALADFEKSVEINPVFTNGYHYRAITKSRLGEYDEALKDFEKAISLRPGNNGIYFSRGVTYFLAQRFDEAVSDFDRYLRHEPNDPSAYLNRGAAHLYLGDTLKALNDYNKAIKLDRYDPEGYIRRARLNAKRELWDEAIEDLNIAIELDKENTFAYYHRGLMYMETRDWNKAMADLNKVLENEPGNALTLYNRSILYMNVGEYEMALDDMDRVININPGNVLAYFNRAACFIELGRWRSALADYTRAIELYPDFAKAYQNRAYVENHLGMQKESKSDYETARRKVEEYQKGLISVESFADTSKRYGSLIDFDADFVNKNFNDELLQHRDIDIRLRPMYRVVISNTSDDSKLAFSNAYENPSAEAFFKTLPLPARMASSNDAGVAGSSLAGYDKSRSDIAFLYGVKAVKDKQYNQALSHYNTAVEGSEGTSKAFYLTNRAVLKAEMVDFIASIENNVQTLSMDDQGAVKTRVNDRAARSYDYSDALADMEEAVALSPDLAWMNFNLGNLYCLQSQPVRAIEQYDKAISEYPAMGDAYFNRGLVLIFLRDKEKGCIDLSRAGELGVKDAYSVIGRYCKEALE